MSSPSGTSSGSSQLQKSSSEEDLQHIMDQKKRKRMLSNRESARRSRTRKQKQLDDLTAEVGRLRNENNQILTSMNMTIQLYLNAEAENSILRAQMTELNHRLNSLNEIINNVKATNDLFETEDPQINDESFMNPWTSFYLNQPIMASADMFMY
ncbi:Basic-leucine zipper domain [Dillenia turbinata]|uniref:Basic-leucine zipper domain n=1 Tax=Dillenia turbinata TaxID=194707 RepID=A0AAN8V2Y9_9MAGN